MLEIISKSLLQTPEQKQQLSKSKEKDITGWFDFVSKVEDGRRLKKQLKLKAKEQKAIEAQDSLLTMDIL